MKQETLGNKVMLEKNLRVQIHRHISRIFAVFKLLGA